MRIASIIETTTFLKYSRVKQKPRGLQKSVPTSRRCHQLGYKKIRELDEQLIADSAVTLRLEFPMKLLIIEDEAKTAAYLKKGLSEQGFVVDTSEDGELGLELAQQTDYDLVVLDVMLPGFDGWAVLSRLRSLGRDLPVLMLTARDAVEDRVKGLNLGADDYLVKPFAFSELVARVRTLLRRGPVRQPEVLRVADLEIEVVKQRATRSGKRLDLTPKEFALLQLLARRAGEVVSRSVIMEQVWDINFDAETNVVEVHVRRLRSKVDDPFPIKLIHTVRGVGYVLDDAR
jgi:two-component system copper resistance phosphate regulon response regulator CusR